MDIQFLTTAPMSSEPQLVSSGNTSDPQNKTFHETLADAAGDSGKIADVAKQFEALIAGQVLKAARESTQGGWLGSDEDQTGQLTLEMAEQSLAQALAAKGSFGMAKLVTASLERKQS